MKILCVAEKPSIAKSISEILSSGNGLQNRPGQDKYCRNYTFTYRMPGTPANVAALGIHVQQGEWVDMVVTSVRGHVMQHDFGQEYQRWRAVDPLALFTAPIETRVSEDAKKIAQNLKAEVRSADLLMIWTDCDREGEHIGSEIVSICKEAKRNIAVKRAHFSAIIAAQIHRAVQHPIPLDYRAAAAVESRIELDLRIGSAFTRFQTMFLQDRFKEHLDKRVISYGPCQFPTLGFVVEQYYKVMDFIPEPFWYIAVMHKRNGTDVDFRWARNHLFVEQEVTTIYERLRHNPRATVKKIESKQTRKFKPHPLTTVELQKAGGRLLRMAPKRILDIAEKLYQRGLLSYPRTETDQYDPAFDFKGYIDKQKQHPEWGRFATVLADDAAHAFERPINGRKNDKAHPPIHPTKPGSDLVGDEKRVYEYVTRRFLASCSKHAIGRQTTITLVIAEEIFTASGIVVVERNYLEVYPYDNWGGAALPNFEEGETFIPTKIEKKQGETSRPKLLTEADLVSLMDRNGIGTDATIAEHIAKIIEREYVMLMAEGQIKYLVPSTLGMGLAEGYNSIELAGEKSLCKPLLRRETEERMSLICEGSRTKEETIEQSLREYNDVFGRVKQSTQTLSSSVARYLLGEAAAAAHSNGQVVNAAPGNGPDDDTDRPGGGGPSRLQEAPRASAARAPTANSRDLVEIDDDDFDDIPIIDIDEEDIAPRPQPHRHSSPPPLRERYAIGSAHGASSRQNHTGTDDTPARGGDGIMCRCPLPAVLRTVSKEGLNKGKTFWSCSKPVSDSTACGFFEWNNDERSAGGGQVRPAPLSRSAANNGRVQQRNDDDDEANVRRCLCGLQAPRIEAAQSGINAGRAFYKCPNISKVAQCKYFEWEDEPRGAGSSSRTGTDTACFTCGQPGHWSSDCPSKGNAGASSNSTSRPRAPATSSRTTASSSRGGGDEASAGSKRGKCYECGMTGHWASDCPDPGTAPSHASASTPSVRGSRGGRGRAKRRRT